MTFAIVWIVVAVLVNAVAQLAVAWLEGRRAVRLVREDIARYEHAQAILRVSPVWMRQPTREDYSELLSIYEKHRGGS